MSNYRRVKIPGATYFFTVVTYERRRILCIEGVPGIFHDIMEAVRKELPFTIKALVILPDHLHCIMVLPENTADYSRIWALIKLRFTKQMSTRFSSDVLASSSRAARHDGTIWQRRFWERMIRDQEDFNAHFHYIHFNPVKLGVARRPADWPHSTFHTFVQEGLYSSNWGGLDVWPDGVGKE
jgi:putative transposase